MFQKYCFYAVYKLYYFTNVILRTRTFQYVRLDFVLVMFYSGVFNDKKNPHIVLYYEIGGMGYLGAVHGVILQGMQLGL